MKCDKCSFKTDYKYNLNRHKRDVHSHNLVKKMCPHCSYSTARSDNMKDHLGRVHDIGEKTCDVCLRNLYITYKSKIGDLCNSCMKKVNNKNRLDRVEKVITSAIAREFPEIPVLAKNSHIRGNSCLKYRPDLMFGGFINSKPHIVQIEIDENQHASYSCDEKRITDIYSEFPAGTRMIVIRFNPHKFRRKNKIQNVSPKIRLANLISCIRQSLYASPETLIEVKYLYYSDNNPNIVKNIKHSHYV